MTSFDTRQPDPEKRTGRTTAPDWEPTPEDSRPTGDRSARRTRGRVLGAAERDRMLDEARESDFPTAIRGYDRAAVDRYVEHVSRIIAELEMSSSPESAVKHALEEVSEETRDILQRAHQTADEVTARSRTKADDRLRQAELEVQQMLTTAQQEAEEAREAVLQTAQEVHAAAQREAAELRQTVMREITDLRKSATEESERLRAEARREADKLLGSAREDASAILEAAETRARELARNADMIWRERRRLVDDIRAVGEQLMSMGELEAKRFTNLGETLSLGDENGHGDTAVVSTSPPEKVVRPE